MVPDAYKAAFDLACATNHPRGEEGSVWPTVRRGGVMTSTVLFPPEHEWTAELCAEVGEAYYAELLALLQAQACDRRAA